ncbi:DUF4349 domain-containing protein [Lunatibacter salilacus]|uniref:DUF4349 domain-containing protein n=1 Tax=Lunatibacter salilacus TaxID=2483804 RepID=UPI00131E351F|nr:DUF4349 domain-containing protein [Lunatibacter salilacus]
MGQISELEEMVMTPASKIAPSKEDPVSQVEDLRKIIKDGNIRFETTDARETKIRLLELVAAHEGYISKDYANTFGDITEYTITVRIPATGFDQIVEKITALAKRIESQHVNSLDVTEEFIDINSRINTKKSLENRYKELLQQSTTVEEILKIEKEIGSLRSEIESIEGRLNYLQNQTSMSTLVVEFHEKSASSRFGPSIGGALRNGWNNLLSFLLWLLNIWPFIIIAVITTIATLRIRKRKSK